MAKAPADPAEDVQQVHMLTALARWGQDSSASQIGGTNSRCGFRRALSNAPGRSFLSRQYLRTQR